MKMKSVLRQGWPLVLSFSIVAAPAYAESATARAQLARAQAEEPVSPPAAPVRLVDDSIHLNAAAPETAPEETPEHEMHGAGTSNAFNSQMATPSGPGGYASGGQLPAD